MSQPSILRPYTPTYKPQSPLRRLLLINGNRRLNLFESTSLVLYLPAQGCALMKAFILALLTFSLGT